jgi:hexosaminidase
MAHIIPAPASLERQGGAPFVLTEDTPIIASSELQPVIETFLTSLEATTGIVLSLEGEQSGEVVRVTIAPDDERLSNLTHPTGVRADDGDPTVEAYCMEVGAGGIEIIAAAPEGAFRGLITLLQVAGTSPLSEGGILIPAMTIRDAPRYAWRGLSFDVVRRAHSVDEVKRVIDLLTLYKANVLHLHLTDSEGWRIEIESWPRLAEIASTTAVGDRPGGYFTKAQYRDLVQYAADRFITVVPEIEMPGHAAAIFRAYPELAGDGVNPETTNLHRAAWFQTMHPDNPRIFGFLEDVFREVSEMTSGGYLHIGGDEALGMDPDLYARFMARAREVAYATGKKIVAWQETSRSGFASDDVAQVWLEPSVHDIDEDDQPEVPEDVDLPPDMEEVNAAFAEAARVSPMDLPRIIEQGARVLLSLQPVAYLDMRYREPSADPGQEGMRKRVGAPFYGSRTIRDFFAWDPGTIKPEVDPDRIVGVEGAIWCETVETADDLFFLLIPRLPGILEKGWSPAAEDAWEAYRPRLAAHDALWEHHGWPYFRSSLVWDHDEAR